MGGSRHPEEAGSEQGPPALGQTSRDRCRRKSQAQGAGWGRGLLLSGVTWPYKPSPAAACDVPSPSPAHCSLHRGKRCVHRIRTFAPSLRPGQLGLGGLHAGAEWAGAAGRGPPQESFHRPCHEEGRLDHGEMEELIAEPRGLHGLPSSQGISRGHTPTGRWPIGEQGTWGLLHLLLPTRGRGREGLGPGSRYWV